MARGMIGMRFGDVSADSKLMLAVGQVWKGAGMPLASLEDIAERANRAGKVELVAQLARVAYEAELVFDERTPLLQQEQHRYIAERERKSAEAKAKARTKREQLIREEAQKMIQRDADARARAAVQTPSSAQQPQPGMQKPTGAQS